MRWFFGGLKGRFEGGLRDWGITFGFQPYIGDFGLENATNKLKGVGEDGKWPKLSIILGPDDH